MADESLRPGYKDTLASDMDHIAIVIPDVTTAEDLETLLLVNTTAVNLLRVVAWTISGDRNGVARSAFRCVPLDADPPGALPVAQVIEIAAGVDFSPPVGRMALPRMFVESLDGSDVDAIVILYYGDSDISP